MPVRPLSWIMPIFIIALNTVRYSPSVKPRYLQNLSSAHAAIAALVDSGLRSVFCYSPHSRAKSFKPFELDREVVTDWMMETVAELARKSPFGNGRVEMGFGMDEFPYSKEKTVEIFSKVKSWGIKIITSHYLRNPAQGMCSEYSWTARSTVLRHSQHKPRELPCSTIGES